MYFFLNIFSAIKIFVSASNYYKKLQNRYLFLNQFLILRANDPYKSSERKVPENLRTIR